jgi:hypothetical protein
MANSHTKSGGPKSQSIIYDPLGLYFFPIDKANIIADCLENLLTLNDVCDYNQKRQVNAGIYALLATVDDRKLLFHLTHLFNHCLPFCDFQHLGEKQKS